MIQFYFGKCVNVQECIAQLESKKINAVLLDSKAFLCKKQFEVAHELAKMAFGQGTNISQNLNTEILLFLACEIHVKNAISKCGAKDLKPAILVVYDSMKLKKNDFDYIGFEQIEREFDTNDYDEQTIMQTIEKMAISRI